VDRPVILIGSGELAQRLGVSDRHIRRLVRERRIPYVRWGRVLRFDPAEIDEWVEANRTAALERTRRTA